MSSDNNIMNIPTDYILEDKLNLVKMNSVCHGEMSVVYSDYLTSKMSNTNLKTSQSIESISSEEMNIAVVNNAIKHDVEVFKGTSNKMFIRRKSK